MDQQVGVPSVAAWQRVAEAVRRVEGGATSYQGGVVPHIHFPAVVVKVTGPKSGGYYPGKILLWNSQSETWGELEDCYIKG